MPRILLVEDNEANREMLTRRLERRGFDVILAVDGQDAIAVAQATSPDLILMDMHLPIVDGWTATRRLKAAPRTQSIPIIALTADAMAGDREKAIAAGCDDYEVKPVEFSRLVEKINARISKQTVTTTPKADPTGDERG